MSACSWILTWFAHSKSKVANCSPILRVWDYLVCSNSASLVFLVTAVLLRLFPEDMSVDTETIMEVCQDAKDAFEFTDENTEDIIAEAERLRYRFCCKRDWVEEYNQQLLPGSKYALKPLGMLRVLSEVNKKPVIFSTIAIVVVLFLISRISLNGSKSWFEPLIGLSNVVTSRLKDLVYVLVRK